MAGIRGGSDHLIVIGAGPVGLAAALLTAAHGPVTLYEAADEIVLSEENSYPIGVNLRGQEALRRIDPALLARLTEQGEMIAAWNIYAGRRRVAHLISGNVIGTTRAFLTRILLDAATADPRITLVTGHRLIGLNTTSRQLTFRRPGGEEATVDASGARVLAADGVWSAARRSLVDQVPGFTPTVDDWGVQFRVLFSPPDASAAGLDPAEHHIFTDKGIYTATLDGGVWGVSLTAVRGAADEELLTSTDASDTHVAALQRHLQTYAPKVVPLLDADAYRAFFGRAAFSGAVVRCPFVHVGEWLVLLGDAAHSVIPPTGEGVNSGLEDCCVLADHLDSGSATPLTDYNAARLPDLAALGEYAWQLMENTRTTDPARRATTIILRILATIASRLGGPPTVEERLFGAHAGRDPYREVFADWIAQRERLHSPIHRVARLFVRGREARVTPSE